MTASASNSKRKFLRTGLACTAAATLLASGLATAQDKYPDKPIRMLIGFAAGGPTDVVGRKLAAVMGATLGQTIVVENKPGASTTIATAELARAKPDGYTLYFTGSAALTITPLTVPSLTYDVMKDLAPIALVGAEQIAFAVHPSVPAKNLRELAALAKANPGKYSFGSSGAGGVGHLAGEMFNQQAGGLTMQHVPYKGAGPAMQDALAGHVQVLVAGLGSMYAQHQAGKLVVLAVADDKRSTIAKEIPTSVESGFPNLLTASLYVMLAPAATPPAIIDAVGKAIAAAVVNEDFLGTLRQTTAEPIVGSTPAATSRFIAGELAKWSNLVKTTGIKLQ